MIFAATLLAATLQLGSAPSRNQNCPDNVEDGCAGDTYLTLIWISDDGSGGDQCGVVCRHTLEPPPAPTVLCEATDLGNWDCEVWPQGPGLTYSWEADSGVELLSDSLLPEVNISAPFQSFICTQTWHNATATVRVTSPTGRSISGAFLIPCSGSAEEPLPTSPPING